MMALDTSIPAIAELASLGQRFVCWYWETRNGTPTKPPIDPNTGRYASISDPATWSDLATAIAAVERYRLDGVGIVLNAAVDGIMGGDFDGCRDRATGELAPWAQRLIRGLRSYTEISPSGTGAKSLWRADPVPELAVHKRTVGGSNGSGKPPGVELYTGGRYFCLTGQILPDVPDEIVDATEASERLVAWIARQKPRPDLPAAFVALLEQDAKLREAWETGMKLGFGGDMSASGLDFALAKYLRPHLDDSDLEAVLRVHPHGQIGGGKLRGKSADRRVANILAETGPRGASAARQPEAGDTAEPIAAQPWPEPLEAEAYYGVVGEIVVRLGPQTEADQTSLLFQLLAALGNIMGRDGYARVEADIHPPRIWTALVGRTSKGRKGTAWGRVRELLASVAPVWAASCIASGMSSGEGVIYAVRDPIEQRTRDKKGEVKVEISDEGVADKRLFLFEGEFAKALRSMQRQGNILSAVLRDAWDHGNLRTLIKNSPNRATGAHVSVSVHITVDELRRCLDQTDVANGLANRILFVCVQRSKLLPRGGHPIDWSNITARLNRILAGVPTGEIRRTDAFWALWEEHYPQLSADHPGLLGAILGRAEAQVLRLALVYALLDRQAFMDACHLRAALAVWRYAEASARFIFGDSLGDPVADEILRALRQRPAGMTRNDLMDHFGRNRTSAEIGRALAALAAGNFVFCTKEQPPKGRPTERWMAK